jgi:DNA-binding MarR family transcriptional regulator
MGIQTAFVHLATLPLTHDARRVLLLMLGRMEYENHIRMSQSDIAKLLGVDKSRVSRAVRLLEKHDIIERSDEKVGRTIFYRLDHGFGWKGRIRNRPDVDEKKTPRK